MNEESKRARRIAQEKRQYERARRYCELFGYFDHREFTDEEKHEIIKRRASSRVPCSCYACGNPRHHHDEKTIQERKSDIDMAEELDDIDAIGGFRKKFKKMYHG